MVKRSAPVSGRANGFANEIGRGAADSVRRGSLPPILCPDQHDVRGISGQFGVRSVRDTG
jgi:hypothetical protein